jgi:aspartate racemase
MLNDLRQRIANLSPEKRALLELRLMQQGMTTVNVDTIPRRSNGAPCALSFAQQRLWFLAQLEPDSVHYNESKAVRLQGPLHMGALQHALDGIVARHEALRTVFQTQDGLPVQVIAPPARVPLPLIELGQCPEDARDAVIRQRLTAEIRRPFDLSRDLMLRAALLQLADEDHILLLVTHHIASDGWSSGILWQELSALYNAHLAGDRQPLPDLPIQYADYALWQREWLQGDALQRQLTYWKEHLTGAPAMLELPTDHPRPPIQTYRGARQTFLFPDALAADLRALSRQEGVTLFMLLLASVQTLLYRYTGESDIVVGSPIAGRTRKETEGLIGFFVNTLILRSRLDDNLTFRDLLQRVREAALGAYAHQDVPFEKLVEELQPERNLSHTPFCQVVFAFQNVPRQVLSLEHLTVMPVDVESGIAKFDLGLFAWEEAGVLRGRVEYNTDLFDGETIGRLVGHWQAVLAGVVATPDQPIATLPLMSTAEQQALAQWQGLTPAYPRDACLHELFEAQVARTPEAVALVCGAEQLTYAALNARANQLAHVLRAHGVCRHSVVGLCLDRGIEAVVGMLAILKAGGTYVPLEPTYPAERLAFLVADTGLEVVLTQTQVAASLPAAGLTVLCLDTATAELAQAPVTMPPAMGSTADDLAYIMYTSGSTGIPKGVSIPHRGVVRLVQNPTYVTLDATETLLQFAPLSFDASTFEIWGSLLNGARLVILPPPLPSLAALGQIIETAGITTLWLPAGLFRELVEHELERLRGVRQLLTGGDVVPVAQAQRVLDTLPDCTLINGYGPTENTTFTCCHRMAPGTQLGSTVPLGQPIGQTQVYVLDRHRQLVPVGILGELYVGGDGLARDYYRRPELTEERFVPHPFDPTPGARLYRTGDWVRWRPDGTLEFLGRLDEQVKIRGFRIELGELETVLGQHPGVREAVVVAREDTPGDKRLIAYYVGAQAPAPTSSGLRQFIQAKVPDYMVPAAFIELTALPLTANGKVDRRALPAPERVRLESDGPVAAPKDALELQLIALWEELLDLRPVGVRDDFFALGGHSLLAVRLFARIEEAIGKALPLSLLFQAPTIEQLAGSIRAEGGFGSPSSLVPIHPYGTKRPFFCVHAGGGTVLGFTGLAKHLGPDQPFYGLEARGLYGNVAPLERLEDMAAAYLQDIRAVQPTGPYVLGGQCIGGLIALEMAQQLRAQGDSADLVVVIDTRAMPDSDLEDELLASLLDEEWPEEKPGRSKAERRSKKKRRSAYLKRRAQELGSTYDRLKTTLRACEKARWRYTPTLYPGRIVLFRGEPETPVPANELRWAQLAGGGFERYVVPGNHRTLLREPNVQIVATQLRALLNAVHSRA